jgi:hypothetical protein
MLNSLGHSSFSNAEVLPHQFVELDQLRHLLKPRLAFCRSLTPFAIVVGCSGATGHIHRQTHSVTIDVQGLQAP